MLYFLLYGVQCLVNAVVIIFTFYFFNHIKICLSHITPLSISRSGPHFHHFRWINRPLPHKGKPQTFRIDFVIIMTELL
jgi:hypothetical protein